MEWGKVKNILIGLFLILNIVLAGNIAGQFFFRQSGYGAREDINQIIANKGVILECNLPFEAFIAKRLVYEDDRYRVSEMANNLMNRGNMDEAGLPDGIAVELSGNDSFVYTNSAPTESFDVENNENLDADIRGMLSLSGVDISEFATDEILEGDAGGKTLYYIQKYQDSLVFDSFVTVHVSASGGVNRIDARFREVKGYSDEPEMQMVPAYHVILKNAFESGFVIKSIDVGYFGHLREEDEQEDNITEYIESAVWRIKLSDGGVRFFEGVYGDEIIPGLAL